MKTLIPIILLITACGGSEEAAYTSDPRVNDMLEEYCEAGIECYSGVVPTHTEVVDCVRSEFGDLPEVCLDEYYELLKCFNDNITCESGTDGWNESEAWDQCHYEDGVFDCCYYDHMDCPTWYY
jgi:hypothetical protein